MIQLVFAGGTLEIRGAERSLALPGATWDERTACLRAPAVSYASIVRALRAAKLEYEDVARRYGERSASVLVHKTPRPFQEEAFVAWTKSAGRGVVVLPTGAGKTHVAVMAIAAKQRDTLIVAPTLDLVRQWYDLLGATFGEPVGLVGGGEHDVRSLTVTTYDSAHLHMEHLGARFGLVVFDEVHHLPSAAYAHAARACLAPFRLGLTATPERADGRESVLTELVGPTVYRKDITDLAGEYLAEYETEQVAVALATDERALYEEERGIYRAFVQKCGIRMSQKSGWGEFVMMSSRSAEGQRAMRAYRTQRGLSFAARGKLTYLAHLLSEHREDRAIVFTQDNATAYEIARRFLIPVITHQTKVKERSHILRGLAEGTYGAIVTSKVLNEGMDVPDANVAVVISGSGSVREHVQRLGRVLRKKEGKRAVLYELVTEATGEAFTSERRREHSAYR
jgi:superfamily II DNA or RNA helicase